MKESFVLDSNKTFSDNVTLSIISFPSYIYLVAYINQEVIGIETCSSISTSKLIEGINTPKRVSHWVCNLHFTLVPEALYNEKQKQNYLTFSNGKDVAQDVLVNENLLHQIKTIFSTSSDSIKEIQKQYPAIQTKHITHFLIQKNQDGFYVCFFGDIMFVTLIKNNSLQFHNGYQIGSKEETLYYISIICEKHNQTFADTQFHVAFGQKKEELLPFWKEYISPQNMIIQAGDFTLSTGLKDQNITLDIIPKT